MPRMRVLDEAYDYIKENDPDSAITKYALRCFILSGDIPSIMCGRKRLIDLDKIDNFFTYPKNHMVSQ